MSSDKDKASNATGEKLAHANQIQDLLADRDVNIPVWIRAPRNNSLEHYSGLSRAKLYELASEGFIRTVSIRKPGQVKGTRLFHLGSLLAFIAKHEAQTVTEEVGVMSDKLLPGAAGFQSQRPASSSSSSRAEGYPI